MEPQRFDGLVRGLARASTRRDLVRAAAASFGGAVLAAIGVRSTAAQFCVPAGALCLRPCCPGLRCREGRCSRCQPLGGFCFSGRECCGNAMCVQDQALGVGRCRCRPGETVCNGVCRDVSSDPFACGGCFNQCLLGTDTCVDGRCCTRAGQTCPGECSANQPCPGCCHGFCHRSGIGRGRLVCGCPPGTRPCGDTCLPDHQCCTDADCAEGFVCSPESRRCVGCPPGERDCGGFCVPVDDCCRDSECTSTAPFCVAGVCQRCRAGQRFGCWTFRHPIPWCDDDTFCGCVPTGEFICGISTCPLGNSCIAFGGISGAVTCQALYFCV
jgi:hypothetical protein